MLELFFNSKKKYKIKKKAKNKNYKITKNKMGLKMTILTVVNGQVQGI